MKNSFEEFLSDKCPCHTNNDPKGFEDWFERLDTQEVMDYAEEYGQKMFNKGMLNYKNYPYSIDS